MANAPLERLIHIPGMRAITPQECLRRIEEFIGQCQGMTAVIILGREGDTHNFACTHTENIVRSQVRETLRTALARLDKGEILPPT